MKLPKKTFFKYLLLVNLVSWLPLELFGLYDLYYGDIDSFGGIGAAGAVFMILPIFALILNGVLMALGFLLKEKIFKIVCVVMMAVAIVYNLYIFLD